MNMSPITRKTIPFNLNESQRGISKISRKASLFLRPDQLCSNSPEMAISASKLYWYTSYLNVLMALETDKGNLISAESSRDSQRYFVN